MTATERKTDTLPMVETPLEEAYRAIDALEAHADQLTDELMGYQDRLVVVQKSLQAVRMARAKELAELSDVRDGLRDAVALIERVMVTGDVDGVRAELDRLRELI